MQKKHSLSRQNSLPFLTILFLLSSIIAIQSCNNDKNKEEKKEQNETVKSAAPGVAAPAPFAAGSFSILVLEKQKLLDLFNDPNAKKLLIQFSDENTATSTMTAVAFSATKKTNIRVLGPKDLIPASTETLNPEGKIILGNNELTEKQIKDLIGGKISTHAADLYFYPKKDANNQIFYIVSKDLVAQTKQINLMITYPATGESSKPSPPAPPCATCE